MVIADLKVVWFYPKYWSELSSKSGLSCFQEVVRVVLKSGQSTGACYDFYWFLEYSEKKIKIVTSPCGQSCHEFNDLIANNIAFLLLVLERIISYNSRYSFCVLLHCKNTKINNIGLWTLFTHLFHSAGSLFY